MRGPCYLSGPVEKDDDPTSWREKVKEEYGYIKWVDPTSFGWIPGENDSVIFAKCKYEVKRSKAMLIRYKEGVPTWGTPFEQAIAWDHGKTIAVWADDMDDLPIALTDHCNYISTDLQKCVAKLVGSM